MILKWSIRGLKKLDAVARLGAAALFATANRSSMVQPKISAIVGSISDLGQALPVSHMATVD